MIPRRQKKIGFARKGSNIGSLGMKSLTFVQPNVRDSVRVVGSSLPVGRNWLVGQVTKSQYRVEKIHALCMRRDEFDDNEYTSDDEEEEEGEARRFIGKGVQSRTRLGRYEEEEDIAFGNSLSSDRDGEVEERRRRRPTTTESTRRRGSNDRRRTGRVRRGEKGIEDDDFRYTQRRPRRDYRNGVEKKRLDDYYDDDYDYDDYDDDLDYDEYNDDDMTLEDEEDDYPSLNGFEWEEYNSNSILLPPSTSTTSTPNAILHFIGGTAFGSLPRQFYSTLLTQIAIRTNSIIVCTPIPITINSNPFNHYTIAKHCAQGFRDVYRNVILDEYYDNENVEYVPIVGMGHSLGARLHMILNTNDKLNKLALRRKGNVLVGFNNYDAGYSVPGVRTLRGKSLEMEMEEREQKKRREREMEEEDAWRERRRGKRRRRNLDEEDDWMDDGRDDDLDENLYPKTGKYGRRRQAADSAAPSRRPPHPSDRRRRRYYDNDEEDYYYHNDNNDDDEDDIEFESLLTDLTSTIQNQITKVKSLVTPKSQHLEFYPTPKQLWDAITNGRYSKNVKRTLLVQFDRDEIDQSSRLARCIIESSSSSVSVSKGGKDGGLDKNGEGDAKEGNDTKEIETLGVAAKGEKKTETSPSSTAPPPPSSSSSSSTTTSSTTTDIKFARLHGNHLTPVSLLNNNNTNDKNNDDWNTKAETLLNQISSSSYDAILSTATGETMGLGGLSKSKQRRREKEMEDLVSSISRYVLDVICGGE